MGQEKHFDPRGIDVCVESLLRLKKQGGQSNPDGLWDSEILRRLNLLERWSNDLPLISDAGRTLRLFNDAQNILECLLESLQTTVSAVASALCPFQRGKGLDSLPDDVLSMILVNVGPESRSRLILVCRRFRQVASGIPQLWSFISNTMKSVQHVHRSLKESKAVALDIVLYLDLVKREPPKDFMSDFTQILDVALVHVNRWKNLRFTSMSGTGSDITEGFIRQLDERLKNIHLPQLRTLSIEYPDEFQDNDDEFDPPNDPSSVVHFYRSWSLPKLHDLHINNFIPVPFTTPALSSLTIVLPIKNGEGHSLLRIIEFLLSIPRLEDLHLTLGELIVAPDLPPLILPHLKSLRLDVMQWMIPQVAPLTNVLVTPTIHSMHFRVERHAQGEPELSEWLETFLCHDEYPTLKDLTFDFFDLYSHSTYEIPFERLPNLESITLDTSYWQADFGRAYEPNEPIPPLHSVRLLGDVDSRWEGWLGYLKKKLQNQGKLANFKSLTISSTDVLGTDDVGKMFAGKRVVWEDFPERDGGAYECF